MKVRIVPIGNSRGIRIPKILLEQTGLSGEVEISTENEAVNKRGQLSAGSAVSTACSHRPERQRAVVAAEAEAVGQDPPDAHLAGARSGRSRGRTGSGPGVAG